MQEKGVGMINKLDDIIYQDEGIRKLQSAINEISQHSIFGPFACLWVGKDIVYKEYLHANAIYANLPSNRVVEIFGAFMRLIAVPEICAPFLKDYDNPELGVRNEKSLQLPRNSQLDMLEYALLWCGLIDIHSGKEDIADIIRQLNIAAEDFGMKVRALLRKIQDHNLAKAGIPPKEPSPLVDLASLDNYVSAKDALVALMDDLDEAEAEELLVLAHHKINRKSSREKT